MSIKKRLSAEWWRHSGNKESQLLKWIPREYADGIQCSPLVRIKLGPPHMIFRFLMFHLFVILITGYNAVKKVEACDFDFS